MLAEGLASMLTYLKGRRHLLGVDALQAFDEAQDCLRQGKYAAARNTILKVAKGGGSPAWHDDLLLLLGWAALGNGDYAMACDVLYILAAPATHPASRRHTRSEFDRMNRIEGGRTPPVSSWDATGFSSTAPATMPVASEETQDLDWSDT
jgi:hypothetical protein